MIDMDRRGYGAVAEPCKFCDSVHAIASSAITAAMAPAWQILDELTRVGTNNLDVLSRLAGFGGSRIPAPVPDGGRVVWRRHESPAGYRDYRLFVPAGDLRGIAIMLHGCTQDPEDFALGTRMDDAASEAGFVVAYPSQTTMRNMKSCWNWFKPENQVRFGGEAEILGSLGAELADEFGLTGRVHVAGLSAGGAMSAILAETHPDVFTSVGIHSGLGAGAANGTSSALSAMGNGSDTARVPALPAIVFQGDEDGTVDVSNSDPLVPGRGRTSRYRNEDVHWTRKVAGRSELWTVAGGGHTWFGGDPRGSHAVSYGPDASRQMLRFFVEKQQVPRPV